MIIDVAGGCYMNHSRQLVRSPIRLAVPSDNSFDLSLKLVMPDVNYQSLVGHSFHPKWLRDPWTERLNVHRSHFQNIDIGFRLVSRKGE